MWELFNNLEVRIDRGNRNLDIQTDSVMYPDNKIWIPVWSRVLGSQDGLYKIPNKDFHYNYGNYTYDNVWDYFVWSLTASIRRVEDRSSNYFYIGKGIMFTDTLDLVVCQNNLVDTNSPKNIRVYASFKFMDKTSKYRNIGKEMMSRMSEMFTEGVELVVRNELESMFIDRPLERTFNSIQEMQEFYNNVGKLYG